MCDLGRILSSALGCGLACALVAVVRLRFDGRHEGDSCIANFGVCRDDRSALSCEDSRYVAVPCRGPEGCREIASGVRCDVSGNRDGDRCTVGRPLGDAGIRLGGMQGTGQCSADGASLVVCSEGQFHREPCRGPGGCKKQGDTSQCDRSIGAVGDRCRDKMGACTRDHTQGLLCVDGALTLAFTCDAGDVCELTDREVGRRLSLTVPGGAAPDPSRVTRARDGGWKPNGFPGKTAHFRARCLKVAIGDGGAPPLR